MTDPERRVTAGPKGLAVRGPKFARAGSSRIHKKLQKFTSTDVAASRSARENCARSRALRSLRRLVTVRFRAVMSRLVFLIQDAPWPNGQAVF